MEKNFTLPAFAEPITALPDTPNLSASELNVAFKRRPTSCARCITPLPKLCRASRTQPTPNSLGKYAHRRPRRQNQRQSRATRYDCGAERCCSAHTANFRSVLFTFWHIYWQWRRKQRNRFRICTQSCVSLVSRISIVFQWRDALWRTFCGWEKCCRLGTYR